ncbi:dihydroxyacetone kinase subunit L [Roseobacter denitrificans]|uniref:Dihydroxyacetone kinase, putative n=1 Tax=Roseobacter denitrificans (strain ATCC 33942 / OCh 114) TaxID=375451 RepID=Q161J4_ROSDO|nr:dihydroxyacetone kinase subunit DhaL [Roseobacter denitrificans]ABG33349.1 dihydroxyacetone kinase, putative [Roseobacter denitrificans OCh 114]AVL52678.1 dihydroxyacetone kinase subunit L [Roseobacter denitrificans]SFG23231.1 homodimeric dihydroxyacetone kinase [Roseobacter denitrificans OCh 114]
MSVQRRKLINHPDNLIEELIAGMVSAHPNHLFVSGETGRAIVAKNGPRDGKVGIVVGGGSGHEPAFAGYVGHGLADAAPLGNIFASPSPSQIMDAGFAADGGAGVLFLYGNYTGDVMNFGMAAEGMAKEGVTARSFVVTDDIASAPVDCIEERRGIAGDFFVFKVAGAAADLGLDMKAVEAAAKRANDATRTMGVALGACTMPQTGQANFELPPGEMEIGMGIHGEPGIERGPAETADAVTDRLLAPILQELDLRAQDRVAVLINGLGSTSLLELYILHNRVAQIMAERSVDIHASWVGEYCTSLDMEGASITIMKLDDDLQCWLDHPCDTPALRVGAAASPAAHPAREMQSRVRQRGRASVVLDDLRSDGPITPDVFHEMMAASAQAIYRERDRLSALDGAIGDGDHGLTMEIGWKAVMARLNGADRPATISAMCDDMADAFLEAVGASAGPLYGTAFQTAGAAVADRLNLDAASFAAWLQGLSDGILARGGAQPGDKTMVDAWVPAAAAGQAALGEGSSVAQCAVAAAQAAAAGAVETKQMLSNRGRSKKLGERSRGHIDPGAESAAVMLQAWAQVLSDLEKS